eukprot:UN30791
MLITDGAPNPPEQNPCTSNIVNRLVNNDITVMILGIGDFDVSQISCVATSNHYIIYIKDFNSLMDVEKEMHKLYCEGPSVQCARNIADTVLLVDDSGSIGTNNYTKLKKWLAGWQYEVMPVGTPVSLFRFGEANIPMDYDWTTFSSAAAFSQKMTDMAYGSGEPIQRKLY